MFELHKSPCRSDPGFYGGHSSHTSSISGDHRPVKPEAGGRRCRFRRMDRSRRWWRKRGVTTAPLCRPGWKWPLTSPCETLSLKLSQTSSGRFMGPSPPSASSPPPPVLPAPQPALGAAGPPTCPQCLFLCALWPCAALWPSSSREECAKHTTQRRVRNQGHDFLCCVCPKL